MPSLQSFERVRGDAETRELGQPDDPLAIVRVHARAQLVGEFGIKRLGPAVRDLRLDRDRTAEGTGGRSSSWARAARM